MSEKVYVLFGERDWEGSEVLGVFTNYDLAKEGRIAKMEEGGWHGYSIHSVPLNETVEDMEITSHISTKSADE